MNRLLKRAFITVPISLVWTLCVSGAASYGNFAYFFGAFLGNFCLIYFVLTIIGLFTKPKKPKLEYSSDDDLFE